MPTTLKPISSAEILMAMIDKAIKDLELIRREVQTTIPPTKKRTTSSYVLIDPRTKKPFALKKPKAQPKRRREVTA